MLSPRNTFFGLAFGRDILVPPADEPTTCRSTLKEFFLSIIFCPFACFSPLGSSKRATLGDGILAFDSIIVERPEFGVLKDIDLVNPSFLMALLEDSLVDLCFCKASSSSCLTFGFELALLKVADLERRPVK